MRRATSQTVVPQPRGRGNAPSVSPALDLLYQGSAQRAPRTACGRSPWAFGLKERNRGLEAASTRTGREEVNPAVGEENEKTGGEVVGGIWAGRRASSGRRWACRRAHRTSSGDPVSSSIPAALPQRVKQGNAKLYNVQATRRALPELVLPPSPLSSTRSSLSAPAPAYPPPPLSPGPYTFGPKMLPELPLLLSPSSEVAVDASKGGPSASPGTGPPAVPDMRSPIEASKESTRVDKPETRGARVRLDACLNAARAGATDGGRGRRWTWRRTLIRAPSGGCRPVHGITSQSAFPFPARHASRPGPGRGGGTCTNELGELLRGRDAEVVGV